ncbi:MAG: transglycosylase family protein [Actinomycetota bacterium]|nr:transglycosylase family protein [Actinomycetota bacterium]
MPSPTLTLVAVAALVPGGAPSSSAHTPATPRALAAPTLLGASSAGHLSLEGQLLAHRRAERRRRKHARREQRLAEPVANAPVLRRIAACESHGNPHSLGGGGAYRGAYQFSASTWRSVGGSGDPAAAPMAEQTRRAARLLARSGPSQWPVCAR